MREAVGGSLLLYLVIPVIIIFIFFIGFVISYAAAYRSANYLVTEMEVCDKSGSSCSIGNLKNNLRSKYHYTGQVDCSCSKNARGYVCGVTLYIGMEIPLLGKFNPFTVKSETKTLSNVSGPVC